LDFHQKGAPPAARARLRFVAGKESATGRDVEKGLLNDGVNADGFHYFIELVEVDFGQITEPKRYSTTTGSAFEIISRDLCQNKPGFIVTLQDAFKRK
jgi:hypothetical protein